MTAEINIPSEKYHGVKDYIRSTVGLPWAWTGGRNVLRESYMEGISLVSERDSFGSEIKDKVVIGENCPKELRSKLIELATKL